MARTTEIHVLTVLQTSGPRSRFHWSWVSEDGSLPGFQTASFSLCLLRACPWGPGERALFSSYKDTNSTGSVHVCKLLQSCPILCYSMDCSLPGSSVHGILQTRILGGGCHFLLQGIVPTKRSNTHLLCLLHWLVGSLPAV